MKSKLRLRGLPSVALRAERGTLRPYLAIIIMIMMVMILIKVMMMIMIIVMIMTTR